MGRILIFLYGAVSYVLFLGAFLYAIGWVGDFLVPRTINNGIPTSTGLAVVINLALLSLFAVQHSIMARPWFKRAWTKIIPKAAERSTYVLLTNLILFLMYWQWRPLPETIWQIRNEAWTTVMWGVFALGWFIVLVSTFLINHFDLFGLRQVWLHVRKQEYTNLKFKLHSFYRLVRHPIMLGFIIAFWATPHMTVGHLIFAGMTTAYILVAIRFEEHDLVKAHGENYQRYRRSVSMILPIPKGNKGEPSPEPSTNPTSE